MGELGAWAKKNSKTLIVDDGETVQAIYKGFKIAANSYDPEKEIVFYQLEVEQDGQLVTKAFKSASGRAARFFDEIKPGTEVKITRHGTGSETKYDFSEVNGERQVKVDDKAEKEDFPF